jgi:hypothetical protein
MYMLKAMDTGFATGHAAPAVGNFEDSRRGLQTWSKSREGFEQCDHLRMRRLLKCRLAWYGFRLIEVGSFRALTKDTLFVDLLQGSGAVLCRLEVDRQSRVITPSAGRALSRLLNSLPGPTANDSSMDASVFVR